MPSEAAGSTALLWLRRDLRLHDHPALTVALDAHERMVPVFVFDQRLLTGRFASRARAEFMLGCLAALDRELRDRGSQLVIRHGRPERELVELARDVDAHAVYWTSDVSPYARERDRRVTGALRGAGIEPVPQGGNYIVDVSKLRTSADEPYRVFSPFFRRWRELGRRGVLPAPEELPHLPRGLDRGELPSDVAELGRLPGDPVPSPIAEPGEPAARTAMDAWLQGELGAYADQQNGMSRLGTSQLSPYLRWGCLSPRELEAGARRHRGKGAAAFVRQLAWREFYAHVLLMWPGNMRHEFQPRSRELEWDEDSERLGAWQRGQTGYPVVDAGMRQLAATGWMHNRARLIVGSFLTKDLHLDWRHGEQWFERLLLDGEPAQNNGNWQWIASVGVDPAPVYRRLYNPALQGPRFDPDGAYVRRWVPELAEVPDNRLWEPWKMTDEEQEAAGCRIGTDYPEPIVDHAFERKVALDRYGAVRSKGG